MIGRFIAVSLALAFLTVAPAVAAGPDFAAMQAIPYDPPKPAPPFALPDLQGKLVRLADLQGKLVWVFFWATW